MSFSSEIQWLRLSAMGSPCAVGYVDTVGIDREGFEADILGLVTGFERRYSRYRPESVISRINDQAAGEWVAIDPETEGIFALIDEAFRVTCGVFDPTALPLLRLWDHQKRHRRLPDATEIERARRLVGWDRIERRRGEIRLPQRGMGIDIGGIGKEYAVDRVVELSLTRGIDAVIVDFGQDVRVHGAPPEKGSWRIGLENPFKPGVCWAGLAMREGAVASSGSYYRNFVLDGRLFGHIIDPRTGYPVENDCRAVTVIAPTCSLAGVLSTTAFILGPEEGLRFLEKSDRAQGCLITGSGCLSTRKFEGYLIEPPVP